MEKKNRIVFSMLTALVIVAAVLSSFGLYYFGGGTPEIVLPTLAPQGNGIEPGGEVEHAGFLPVEVTPKTVQSVIETMERWPSYSRTVTLEVSDGAGQVKTFTANVWVDSGWTRVEMSQPVQPMGRQYTIVGDGAVYRWYGSSGSVKTWDAGKNTGDLAQRIPTYQDVLDLPQESIVDAGYVERDGLPCIYVETSVDELGYLERFWVSEDSGLLVASETVKEDAVVLRMKSSAVNALALEEMDFSLPDGTVLHTAGQA